MKSERHYLLKTKSERLNSKAKDVMQTNYERLKTDLNTKLEKMTLNTKLEKTALNTKLKKMALNTKMKKITLKTFSNSHGLTEIL